LIEVFLRQNLLLRDGDVVWGALVQANRLLFKAGRHDHPARVIHSADPSLDDGLDRLRTIASRLFQLKGTLPDDPGQRHFAEMITDETECGMGWTVPKGITGGPEVRSTGLMVFRRHLPGGVLRSGWFPLLTHPSTSAVMIVPWRYWPDDLVEIWKGKGLVA
jgi:hypothetical protein